MVIKVKYNGEWVKIPYLSTGADSSINYVEEAPKNGQQYTRKDGAWTVLNIPEDITESINSKVDKVEGKELSSNDFTDAYKTKLDGIAENANNYVHPTTSGNKHIPAGGSSGQILRWESDGTAIWGNDNNTVYTEATTTVSGLMSAADKVKLNGIAAGAEVNVNADWNAVEGDAQILNKPTLATVATSGQYSDLTGIPSLSNVATSGSYNDLSNKPTIITSDEVDQKINTAVGSVYRVKGTVANYNALPTTNVVVGDVYNLEDTGANYVATSTTPTWDKLSETVDLSAYSTTAQNDEKYQPKGNYSTSFADEEDITSVSNKLKLKDRAYDEANFSGLGYKILRKNIQDGKNILIQDEINKSNTVYEIRYDFDLRGEEITIPEGCTLKFEGGSLNNGTIIFNNTIIEGYANIYTDIKGTINGTVNIEWFLTDIEKENDISNKLQKIASLFKDVELIGGEYNIINPIIIESPKNLKITSVLHYKGTNVNTAVITIKNTSNSNIIISALENDRNITNIDLINDNTNVIGIDFINCNKSIINVRYVGYFNEGVRLSGIGAGCCYNKIYINTFSNNNRHIRIYQNNGDDGSIGWTNENLFLGGHLATTSDMKKLGMKQTAIHIEGGNNDSYNKVNNLAFYNYSTEGFGDMNGYTIYAKKVSNCSFIDFRNEAGDTFIQFDGDCRNNYFRAAYAPSNCSLKNIKDMVVTPVKIDSFRHLYTIDISKYQKRDLKGNVVADDFIMANYITDTKEYVTYDRIPDDGVSLVYQRYGIVIDTSKTKIFYINKNSSYRLFMLYLEDIDGNKIDGNTFMNYDVCAGFRAVDSTFMAQSDRVSSIIIPDNISKIFIGTQYISTYMDIYYFPNDNTVDNTVPNIEIIKQKSGGTEEDKPLGYIGQFYFNTTTKNKEMFNGDEWVILNLKKSGTFNLKPNNPPIGFSYLCTDKQTSEGSTNGIMIYHKGNNVWVDALGRVVE